MTATESAPTPAPARGSVFSRLYHGETNIQFVTRLKRWLLISGVVIVVGLTSLYFRGLNLGIDFKGGVVWELPAGQLSVAKAQDAMRAEGLQGVSVQSLQAKGVTRLRVKAEPLATTKDAEAVSQKLADLSGSKVNDVSLNSVGPSWGEEISRKALRALIFFLIAITIYISLRFEFKMAVPTLIALIHDILITIGVYSLAGFEVTPATVIALLTILGFSIYDGIVVFDKVDENSKLVGTTHNLTYGGMVNLSLNQVLMRSLNTSITALLPVASLLVLGSFILGATTLEEFALALLIGLFAGAYSSIFIASPLLSVLKEREPRYRDLKAKLEARQAQTPLVAATAGASAAGAAPVGATARRAVPGDAPALSGRPIPARPRKKGKKR
ncbi:MAG: protein translocase subunit SecF [Acidimicrobiales bacterium]